MTDDNNDGGDGIMLSRRDAIRGGAAIGTLALASRIGAYAQVVEAQITEPRIQLGSDYTIHDSGGDLVINHDPNGDIFLYDASADKITTLKPLTSATIDDHGLTVGGVQSDFHWKEDGNSPDSASNVGSYTYTLDGTYDIIWVFVEVSDVGNANDELQLRVNGDSGANYNVTNYSGSQNLGQNSLNRIAFVNDLESPDVVSFVMEGRFDDEWNFRNDLGGIAPAANSLAYNSVVSSPIASITLLRDTNMDVDSIEVYGRDL